MIYNDFNSLRVEHVGENLILRQAGIAAAIFHVLTGGFCFGVGGLTLFAFVSNFAQGFLLPIEPRTWYKWLLWAVVMNLFGVMLVVMPFSMGIDAITRDRFTIDRRSRSLATWRGVFCLPIRRRSYPLNQFRDVVIRPALSGVFGKRWHWIVSLEGEDPIKLVSVDNPTLARTLAGEISQMTGLPVREYSADA